MEVAKEYTPGSQGQRDDWSLHGVCNATVTGRFTGKYIGKLVRGPKKLVMRQQPCAEDQGAVALWDSCGKTAVSECVGYLDRDTAALVRASIAAGDSVEVEYVGTKHRGSEGHPVDVLRLMSTPKGARHATRRQGCGVKRAVHFDAQAAVARMSSDGDSDREDDSSSTGRACKQRRVSARALAAARGRDDSSVGDSDSVSDEGDEDEEEDEADTRTVAQLQYKRVQIVGEVVVDMRVMGHWSDINGWYPAKVTHVFASGEVKYRIEYDDGASSDVTSDERIGKVVK
jgi:hypothetical protein